MKKALLIAILLGVTNILFAQLDKSSCIPGTVGGGVDVSPSGAANFQLPIQVSPGSHGMQPNLSVVYSSQAGNGLLGWGWNLAGLSSISRASKTNYYDNTFEAISLTDGDALALDGVRLVKDASGVYHPANNPYTNVSFAGNVFTVTTQDGVVMEYGKAVVASGSTLPIAWNISRITDTEGNYIQFNYEGDNSTGEYRISNIDYTGNSTNTAYNHITFSYIDRTDVNYMYVAGAKVTQSKLLASIKVDNNGVVSKSYGFTYFMDQYSKLNKITLTADGVTFNPTKINWISGTYNLTTSDPLLGTFHSYQLYTGDFNGDGITDIAKWDRNIDDPILVSIAQSGGGYISKSLYFSTPTAFAHQTANVEDINILDRDGDGKDDILIHFTVSNNDYVPIAKAKKGEFASKSGAQKIIPHPIFLSDRQRDFVTVSTYANGSFSRKSETLYGEEGTYMHFYGDVNNDGAIENLTVKDRILSTCDNLGVPLGTINNIDDIKLMDFDGDGRTDILTLSKDGKGSIWEYNGTTFVNKYGNSATTFFGKPKNVFLGDFNGDGKTDYLSYASGGWHLYYSTGVGFVEGVAPSLTNAEPDITGTWNKTVRSVASTICTDDVSNDGKADICQAVDGNFGLFISRGNTFDKVATSSFTSSNNAALFLQVVDLNNDGQKEFLYGSESCSSLNEPLNTPYKKISIQQDLRNYLLVNNIVDGLGNQFTFTYNTYLDNREFTPSFVKPTLPLMLVRGPWQVVSQLQNSILGTATDTQLASQSGASSSMARVKQPDPPVITTFTYVDGYSHIDGLGFLGFKTVTAHNLTSDISTTSSLDYTIPELQAGIYSPWLREVITTKGSILISKQTVSTMGSIGGDPTRKLFSPVVRTSSSIDLKGVTANTTNEYNAALGRLTKQTVGVGAWTVITEYTFDGSNRIVSLTTTKKNENGSHTTSSGFSYYGNTRRLHTKTEKGITTSFDSFDSYGNPIGFSVASNSRPSSCKYDDKGRFVVESTDVLGNTSYATYRSSDGAKMSETNSLGIKDTYSYTTGNGSLITTVSSDDGNISTITLGWDQTGLAGLYSVEKKLNGTVIQTLLFNARGQKVGETSKGYKGAVHTNSYSYNTDGSLYSASTSGISAPTTYSYTPDGRIEKVTGLNTSITYSYSGLTETFTDNISGINQIKTYDPVGNLTNVGGKMGSVSYTYNPSGAVKEINAESGKTTMGYDDNGNQTSLIDPNAGTTTYTYDEFNQMKTQIDAVSRSNGKEITFMYDAKGLLTKKIGSETIEEYTYSTLFGRGGQLDNVTRTRLGKKVSESYTYDGFGRVLTSQTVGDGKTFITTNVYNGIGQLSQVTQSTGLTLKYTYDNVGNITSIISVDNGTSTIVWDGVSKNGLEQWTSFKLGNGLTTKYGYDAGTNMLQSIKTGITGNDTLVQNLGFTFNTTGQLTKRTEGLARSESFTYDGLNRLTAATVAGKSPVRCSYDPNGNITGTSLAATYTYNSSHINAVSNVTGPLGVLQSDSLRTTSTFTDDNRIYTIDNSAYNNTFTYGPGGNRFMVTRSKAGVLVNTKYYDGCNEYIGDTSRTFIYAPTGICAVWEKVGSAPGKYYYIHTDYLGSWLKITNQDKSIAKTYSYDAWGRPRNPNTWEPLPIGAANSLVNLNNMQPRFDRGYTGHEQMAGFGLINMNGRLYDPYLQRFLSPDNMVQDPLNAQNYNRYSYCLNNPLMYTDPTGWLTKSLKEIYNSINTIASGTEFHYMRGDLVAIELEPGATNSEIAYLREFFGYDFEIVAKSNWIEEVVCVGERKYNWDAGANATTGKNQAKLNLPPKANPDDKRFTTHISTEFDLPGLPLFKAVTNITKGTGPIHMKIVNGSKPSQITFLHHGPITIEINNTDGGSQSYSVSTGNNYFSVGYDGKNLSIGAGAEKGDVSSGLEMQVPSFVIQLMLLPVIEVQPVLEPILVPVW